MARRRRRGKKRVVKAKDVANLLARFKGKKGGRKRGRRRTAAGRRRRGFGDSLTTVRVTRPGGVGVSGHSHCLF